MEQVTGRSPSAYWPSTGTIVIGVRRDDSVILAADTWSVSGQGTNEYSAEIGPGKITCHESIPLAIATGGLTDLPNASPNKEIEQFPTKDFIEYFMGTIKTKSDTDPMRLQKSIKSFIMPHVEWAIDLMMDNPRAKTISNLKGYLHLEILVATFLGNKPFLTRYWIDKNFHEITGDYQLINSSRLDSFLRPKLRDGKFLAGHIRDSREAGKQLKLSVKQVIDYEKANFPENCRSCGGNIDVAIVDHEKARFL